MFDHMRQRIQDRCKDLRISQRQVSREIGAGLSFTNDVVSGVNKNPDPERILRLADVLDTPLQDLLGDSEEERELAKQIRALQNEQGWQEIPLFAARIPMNEPFVEMQAKPVDHISPFRTSGRVEGGYAVAIFNTLNEPRYMLGETAFVSPSDPVRIGDFVFARSKNGRAAIGRLAQMKGKSATLQLIGAHGTPSEIPVNLSDMVSFHRIIGSMA